TADYENDFPFGSTYQGLEPGDSGGPLLINNVICGVNSNDQPPPYGFGVASIDSAVDSPDSLSFLTKKLLVPGTTRIVGLCADDKDPSTQPPGVIDSTVPYLSQMPHCAPADDPAPGFLMRYKFRLPQAFSTCAPGEPTTVTGMVTQVDGVNLWTPI